jgi:SAM-dependent methyltransferase
VSETEHREPRRNAYDAPGVAARYARDRFAIGSGPRTHARESARLGALLARIEAPRRVLDIPCGTGRFAAFFPHATVVRADLSIEMLRETQQLDTPRTRLALARAEALPFASASVDLVFCIRLLHHLDEGPRRAALRELARVSRVHALVSIYLGPSLQGARRAWKHLRGAPRRSRRSISTATFHADLAATGWRPLARLPLRRFLSESWYYLLSHGAAVPGTDVH